MNRLRSFSYFRVDRASKKAKFLFVHQPKLEGLKLSEMKAYTVTARDGLKLPVYLTLPAGYGTTPGIRGVATPTRPRAWVWVG